MSRWSSPRAGLLILLLMTAVILVVLLPLREWMVALVTRVEGFGPWAAVILGAVWVPAAILLVPGSLITLGTGFLLGVGWGLVTVSAGSTLGAVAAFLVGRTLARERVREWIAARPRFEAVDRAIGTGGFQIVLLTRLSPLFPYNFQNYAFALTGIRIRDYALGSWIGMLPGTLLYVYLGSSTQALAAIGTGERERSALEWAFYAVGLVATAAVTWLVTRRATAILEERTGIEIEADG